MKENGVQSVMITSEGKKLRSSAKVLDMGECLILLLKLHMCLV